VCATALIHVVSSARRVALKVGGWAGRETEEDAEIGLSGDPGLSHTPDPLLDLNGSRAEFIDAHTALLCMKDGQVHIMTLVVDGSTVNAIELGPAVAQSGAPALMRSVGEATHGHGHVLVGSVTGDSALLEVQRIEDEDEDVPAPEGVDVSMEQDEKKVGIKKDDVNMDEDDGKYL
jgi:hypothetical protein